MASDQRSRQPSHQWSIHVALAPPRRNQLDKRAFVDEPAIRLMIADALRHGGFEVVETGSGDEALAVVESGTTVHLAFVDVRLPGTMDGIALVSRLRETHPDIKLAVVSAYPPDWPSPRLSANPTMYREP